MEFDDITTKKEIKVKIQCTPTGIEITTSRQHLDRMGDSLKAVASNSFGWFKLHFADEEISVTFIAAEDEPSPDPTVGVEYTGPPLTY